MSVFSVMRIRCCICGSEIDGMVGYGRSRVCDKECHNEMKWRETLAMMGKLYVPQKGSRWDPDEPTTVPPFPRETACDHPGTSAT